MNKFGHFIVNLYYVLLSLKTEVSHSGEMIALTCVERHAVLQGQTTAVQEA
jgi:hypothetical protein